VAPSRAIAQDFAGGCDFEPFANRLICFIHGFKMVVARILESKKQKGKRNLPRLSARTAKRRAGVLTWDAYFISLEALLDFSQPLDDEP